MFSVPYYLAAKAIAEYPNSPEVIEKTKALLKALEQAEELYEELSMAIAKVDPEKPPLSDEELAFIKQRVENEEY